MMNNMTVETLETMSLSVKCMTQMVGCSESSNTSESSDTSKSSYSEGKKPRHFKQCMQARGEESNMNEGRTQKDCLTKVVILKGKKSILLQK